MNKKIYCEVNIDLTEQKYILINAKQYDSKSRFVLVTCYNDGNLLELSTKSNSAFVRYKKADGFGVFNECGITDDGKIMMELTEQMLAVSGTATADIMIVDNTESSSKPSIGNTGTVIIPEDSFVISSMLFYVNIIPIPLDNAQIESTYEFSALNDLLKKVNADYEKIITISQGYADEAKTNKELALQYATNAKESEENAKVSETNAKLSEDNSKTYESNTLTYMQSAKEYMDNASTSADNAKVSKTNAKESEENAKVSETNAGKSESNALQSETNAKVSEENAFNSAESSKDNATLSKSYAIGGTSTRDNEDNDNAKYYKDLALDYSNNSRSSEENIISIQNEINTTKSDIDKIKDDVSASVIGIKQSEDNAKESEQIAITKASEAFVSAENAKTSETNIKGAETTCEQYAKISQSYAIGGTDYREDESSNNAKYYYQQVKQIGEGLSGALFPMGTIAFEELSIQTKEKGYMYNISNSFTSDDTFKDGGGLTYPAGTNVYYTADGYWDCLTGTMISGVKGNAETDYRTTGNINITPDNIGVYDKVYIDALVERIVALESTIEDINTNTYIITE